MHIPCNRTQLTSGLVGRPVLGTSLAPTYSSAAFVFPYFPYASRCASPFLKSTRSLKHRFEFTRSSHHANGSKTQKKVRERFATLPTEINRSPKFPVGLSDCKLLPQNFPNTVMGVPLSVTQLPEESVVSRGKAR